MVFGLSARAAAVGGACLVGCGGECHVCGVGLCAEDTAAGSVQRWFSRTARVSARLGVVGVLLRFWQLSPSSQSQSDSYVSIGMQ